MVNKLRKISSRKLLPRHCEMKNEEYWKERKGVVKCPNCVNVHFKKRWYASEEDLRRRLKIEKLSIAETKLCPACKMIKERAFEGEVFIEGFPERHIKELLRLVKNFGERTTQIDPQDRIIKIEETDKGYRITTTENQLADKIANKIKDAFNTVDIQFSFSAEPAEVSRIHVVFRGI